MRSRMIENYNPQNNNLIKKSKKKMKKIKRKIEKNKFKIL